MDLTDAEIDKLLERYDQTSKSIENEKKIPTVLVKKYLAIVARGHIEDNDEYESVCEDRDSVWETMDADEQAVANDLVQAIFGEWL